MYRTITFLLLLTFTSFAETGLDKTNKLHEQLIGEWSVDLESTTKEFEKLFGKGNERFLSRLPSVLMKLKRNQLTITEKGFKINDGRFDYKIDFPEVRNEKNKLTLSKVKGGSLITGFELLEDNKMKLISKSRDHALFIWQKKKLDKKEAEKIVEKILTQYKGKGLHIDITRYVHINEYEALVKLLKEKPEYANYAKDSGRTALHEACRFKKTKFVKLLLENGADPNAQINLNVVPDGGDSAFHIIAKNTSTEDWDKVKEICELLIKHKADVNLKGKYDEYPLNSALEISNSLPNEKLAIFLINNGAHTTYVNDFGETPIHQAFRYGVSEEFVKLMAEKKIKIPNQINKLGMAPPAMATRSNKIEVLKLFQKHGFDLTQKNEKGGTLLHFAISNEKTLKYVLDNVKGIDIEADSQFYGTAMRRAMATGKVEAVKILLEYGAKIPQNYDPTQIASRADDERAIQQAALGMGSSRRFRNSSMDISDRKLFCIKEVHAEIKTFLDKQK